MLRLILKLFKYEDAIISRIQSFLLYSYSKNLSLKLKIFSLIQILTSKLWGKLIRRYSKMYQIINEEGIIVRNNLQYKFANDIFDYYINNNIVLEKITRELDKESKNIFRNAFNAISYIFTHVFICKKDFIKIREFKEIEIINMFISSLGKIESLSLKKLSVSVFFYKCGLKFLPESIIQKLEDSDFLDGGAFDGSSALMFEKNYKPNRIIAFEPDPTNYFLLLKTIDNNNLTKVIPVKKGLGERVKQTNLISSGDSSYISAKGAHSIQITTIDEYVSQFSLKVGLIKLDIEGYALNALNGATNTVKNFRPVLLIQIYHNGKEFFEIINYIKKLNPNYKIIIRKLSPQSLFVELSVIAW